MANITLKTSCNGGTIRFGEQSKGSDVNLNNSSMPKYVGARATVTRTEEGVRIWLKDYQGETTEIVAEAIQDIVTNDDGTLTFILPDGREITTDSLAGEDGFSPIATVSKSGDTTTITITDINGTTTAQVFDGESSYTETDPVFAASAAHGITASDISNWNDKSEFSGRYEDLSGKPGNATSSTNGFMASTDKAKLDSIAMTNGIIDASVLPSYVDDVIEAYGRASATPLAADWLSLTNGGAALTPERGKIYILMYDHNEYMANQQFRWSGSAYVPISSLGGSGGVFIADYGRTSYDDVLYAISHGAVAFCRVNSLTDTKLARVVNYKTVDGKIVFTFKYVHGCLEGTISVDPDNGWSETLSYIQSNWAESDTTSPTYIQNKPPLTITNYMYPGDKMKIAEIALTNSTPTSLYASEWYVAEYNTDSYVNTENAFNAGRDIVCKYVANGTTWYLPLVDFDSTNSVFYFSVIRNSTEVVCSLADNGGWSHSENVLSGVQSDWNQSTTTAADYIKNKPTIPSKVSDLANDSGFITVSGVPTEIFWATYGTTTSAEIETAYQAGKVVCVNYGNQIYTLCMRESGNVHNFSSTSKYEEGDVYISVIRCTNSVWSTAASIIPASASDIPAATSDLTNDSGFITVNDLPDYHDIFWATYGTTTTTEIVQATNAYKIIFVEYGSRIYSISKINSSSSHEFTCFDSGVEYRISCNGNVWTASQTSFVPLDSYGKIDASYLPTYNGGVS